MKYWTVIFGNALLKVSIFEMSFWYLQFFLKLNKKIRPNDYGTSSRIVFIRFLEESKTPIRHFEIN